MSTAFESIKLGLQEAIEHAKANERGVRALRGSIDTSFPQG